MVNHIKFAIFLLMSVIAGYLVIALSQEQNYSHACLTLILPSCYYFLILKDTNMSTIAFKIFHIVEFIMWGLILPLMIGYRYGSENLSLLNGASILYAYTIFRQKIKGFLGTSNKARKLFGLIPFPISSGGAVIGMLIVGVPLNLMIIKLTVVSIINNDFLLGNLKNLFKKAFFS